MAASVTKKPEGIEQLDLEEYLLALDYMREAGQYNMRSAFMTLVVKFPELNEDTARVIQQYWMDTYEETHVDNGGRGEYRSKY